jgi:hypothetical protein
VRVVSTARIGPAASDLREDRVRHLLVVAKSDSTDLCRPSLLAANGRTGGEEIRRLALCMQRDAGAIRRRRVAALTAGIGSIHEPTRTKKQARVSIRSGRNVGLRRRPPAESIGATSLLNF